MAGSPSQWRYYETHLEAMFAVTGCAAPTDGCDGKRSAPSENHAPASETAPAGQNHTEHAAAPAESAASSEPSPAENHENHTAETAADGGPAQTGGADGKDAVGPAATARFLLQLRVSVDARERAPLLAQLRLALALRQRRLPHPAPVGE